MGTYRLVALCRDAVYETFQIRKRQVRAQVRVQRKQLGDQEGVVGGQVGSSLFSSCSTARKLHVARGDEYTHDSVDKRADELAAVVEQALFQEPGP
jgi:hypothetical protein